MNNTYPYITINNNTYQLTKKFDIEEENRSVYYFVDPKPIKWILESEIDHFYYYKNGDKPKIYSKKIGKDLKCILHIDEDIEMELDGIIKLCFYYQSADLGGCIDMVKLDRFFADNILFEYNKEKNILIPKRFEMSIQKNDFFE